nr:hypothetical protein StreXyl84_67940 [Streptomyces sp. Xyl84]
MNRVSDLMREADAKPCRSEDAARHTGVRRAVAQGGRDALSPADAGESPVPLEGALPQGPTAHVSALRLLLAGLQATGGDGAALAWRAGAPGRMPAGECGDVAARFRGAPGG